MKRFRKAEMILSWKDEVETRIELQPELLIWPEEQDFQDWEEGGHTNNHQFVDLRGAEWSDVDRVIPVEREIIEIAAERCESSDEFMDRLEEVAEEVDFANDFPEMSLIDTGVVSTVWALSASGCAPFESCAGHELPPHVVFYVPNHKQKERLDLIVKAALEAGAGVANNLQGRLEVFGDSIARMLDFAEVFAALARGRGLQSCPPASPEAAGKWESPDQLHLPWPKDPEALE